MIRARLFHSGHASAEAAIADWPALCQDDMNILWVDAHAPSEAEFAEITRLFHIDPRAAENARQVSRRATVRVFEDHHLVTVLAAQVDEAHGGPRITVVELDIFIGKNYLVSLHKRAVPFAQEFDERTTSNPHVGHFDSAYLLYVLLDTLVAYYARVFDQVEDRVEHLEEQLLHEPGRGALHDVTLMRRHLLRLRRLISPHREAFGVLLAVDPPLIRQEGLEMYFRDLLGHLDRVIEQLDHTRDVVSGSYNLYISNMSHRTNEQLKVLTFLSAVLLPMTVITGLFGTNFKVPAFEDETLWPLYYVMLLG
ncbi:MAG: magnesium transporter CorA family protein, partial [Chloroflexi bacterium]|nr:magnesium transporter CorA family protein [Chloroflexota bacterium]